MTPSLNRPKHWDWPPLVQQLVEGQSQENIEKLEKLNATLADQEKEYSQLFNMFRHTCDNIPLGLFVKKRNGIATCCYVNNYYMRMVGYGADELDGANWTKVIPARLQEGVFSTLMCLKAEDMPFTTWVTYQHKDGHEFDAIAEVFFIDDQYLIGYVREV